MRQYLEILKKCPMFQNMEEQEILSMLSCLGARVRTFQKREYIVREGESVRDIGGCGRKWTDTGDASGLRQNYPGVQ